MAGKITGTFGATGQSDPIVLDGITFLSLSGFGDATVLLQRSPDEGANWKTVGTYTADAELGVIGLGWPFRLNCSVYSSGTIAYTLGRLV